MATHFTASSSTSTELPSPDEIGGKRFYSKLKEKFVVIFSLLLVTLMMSFISPGIAIQFL